MVSIDDFVLETIDRVGPNPRYMDVQHFFTHPSPRLVASLKRTRGDFMGLGIGGKMGEELGKLLANGLIIADGGVLRNIGLASRWSDGAIRRRLNLYPNIKTYKVDLLNPRQFQNLPSAPNAILMAGRKFGVNDERSEILAHATNVLLPQNVALEYPNIVVFSSGNPYDLSLARTGGLKENGAFRITHPYSAGVRGREDSMKGVAMERDVKLSFNRLMFSQHLCYGVIVDIAKAIEAGADIYLDNGSHINLVFQKDANEAALNQFMLTSNRSRGLDPVIPYTSYEGERDQYGSIINVAGVATSVRYIATRLQKILGKKAKIIGSKKHTESMLADDSRYRSLFGEYEQQRDAMIDAVGHWIKAGGQTWSDKQTHFGMKGGF
jgi:hypothetical protein